MKTFFVLFSFSFILLSCETNKIDKYSAIQNTISENFNQLSIDESGFVMYDCDWPNGSYYKFDIADIEFTKTIEEEGSTASYCFNGPCPETIYIWFRCSGEACIGDKPYDGKGYNYRGILAFTDIEYGEKLFELLVDAQELFQN